MNRVMRVAMGAGIVAMMGIATAQGALLLEFDANNDFDPNNGWDFTGAISGTLPVDLTLSGQLVRQIQGDQAYFQRTGDDRFFNGSLGGNVSVTNWSVEIWVRKTTTGNAGTPEDHVVNFRDNAFDAFISISGGHNGVVEEPDFDHRDFNGGGARSQINDAFNWPEGVWQHWVATYQDSAVPAQDNGVLTIYVNGVQVAQDANQKPTNVGSSAFTTAGIFVFTSSDWNRGLSGDIAIVRLHDNILTQEEIDASYLATADDMGLIAPTGADFTNVSLANTEGMEFESDTLTEYTLQLTTDLITSSGWMNAATVLGTGANMYFFDPTEATGSSTSKAYRVITF